MAKRFVVGWGTHICASMMRSTYKDKLKSWEEGIYGLPSSFEVAKYSLHVASYQAPVPCFAWDW
jgi:hypothetical protein